MRTVSRSTKPHFVPDEGYPITLHPDVMSTLHADGSHSCFVWMGPYDTVTGVSNMGGPDAERAAYENAILMLANLAFHHYNERLALLGYIKEEQKGTSFDDSAD